MRFFLSISAALTVLFTSPLIGNAQNAKPASEPASHADSAAVFLIKKTTLERNAMSNPTAGTAIFNSTTRKVEIFNGKTWKDPAPDQHYVGKPFQGGIIVYLDSTRQHGLITAPFDQHTAAQWVFFKEQVGANEKNIGTGNRNTGIIAKNSKDSTIAANICNNLVLHGYTDWFLPSIEELKLMYLNFTAKGLGNFLSNQYWSSSETDFNNAWIMNFALGTDTENNVVNSYAVRAVRYF